jgi:hypothetical protein
LFGAQQYPSPDGKAQATDIADGYRWSLWAPRSRNAFAGAANEIMKEIISRTNRYGD